jgi:hypothetical protein
VYGVEGESFEYGVGLSLAVEKTIRQLARMIESDLKGELESEAESHEVVEN